MNLLILMVYTYKNMYGDRWKAICEKKDNSTIVDVPVEREDVDFTKLTLIDTHTWVNIDLLYGIEMGKLIFKDEDGFIYLHGYHYDSDKVASLLIDKELLDI